MSKRKEQLKDSFKRYAEASSEKKDCKEPCLKNGKSDRYCLECANDILGNLITKSIKK
jgi:hypothetical protein